MKGQTPSQGQALIDEGAAWEQHMRSGKRFLAWVCGGFFAVKILGLAAKTAYYLYAGWPMFLIWWVELLMLGIWALFSFAIAREAKTFVYITLISGGLALINIEGRYVLELLHVGDNALLAWGVARTTALTTKIVLMTTLLVRPKCRAYFREVEALKEKDKSCFV